MKYFDNYKEIKRLKPESLRSKLRSSALDIFSVLDNIKGIEKQLDTPRIQFLYIHHIFKDEEVGLDKLMKRLKKNHEFISYSESVNRILEGKIDKPYISISSDDGFKNNLRAAEILNEYGANACFFINPAVVEIKSFAQIEEHCKNRLNFPAVEFMNWSDIETLQKMGHEIGGHTMEHMNVAKTDKDKFAEDCRKSFDILSKNCGEAKHFAFPYGRFFHFNESARKIVFDAGFISCASAERGCHINHGEPLLNTELCIRRDHVILDWNIDHTFHFLANNVKKATSDNNLFPYPKT